MNSLEILQALLQIPRHTIGVYPSDLIPKKWGKPAAFVFNTENSKKPGAHWVAVYVDKKAHGYYFDSFGMPPFVQDHIDRLRENCKMIKFNKKQLQSESSVVCGQFCIMFLFYAAHDIELHKFFDLFASDLEKNDSIVEEFAAKVQNHAKKKKKKTDGMFSVGNGCDRRFFLQSCVRRG